MFGSSLIPQTFRSSTSFHCRRISRLLLWLRLFDVYLWPMIQQCNQNFTHKNYNYMPLLVSYAVSYFLFQLVVDNVQENFPMYEIDFTLLSIRFFPWRQILFYFFSTLPDPWRKTKHVINMQASLCAFARPNFCEHLCWEKNKVHQLEMNAAYWLNCECALSWGFYFGLTSLNFCQKNTITIGV